MEVPITKLKSGVSGEELSPAARAAKEIVEKRRAQIAEVPREEEGEMAKGRSAKHTDEERKAKQREYAKAYYARQKAAKGGAAPSVPGGALGKKKAPAEMPRSPLPGVTLIIGDSRVTIAAAGAGVSIEVQPN